MNALWPSASLTGWFRSNLSEHFELRPTGEIVIVAFMLITTTFTVSANFSPKMQIQTSAFGAIVARCASTKFMAKFTANTFTSTLQFHEPFRCWCRLGLCTHCRFVAALVFASKLNSKNMARRVSRSYVDNKNPKPNCCKWKRLQNYKLPTQTMRQMNRI